MTLKELAVDYEKSAQMLKQRVSKLKTAKSQRLLKEQKQIEDRIVVLNAEYYHLISVSTHLNSYLTHTEGEL